jgi:tetratricopeptide (TPR) repeat protein
LPFQVCYNRKLSTSSARKAEVLRNPTFPLEQTRSGRPRELDFVYTLVQRGQFKEALGEMREEITINDKFASPDQRIWAHLLRGMSYEGLSDASRALQAYEMACELVREHYHVDSWLPIECFRRYCQTLHTLGSYDALLEGKRCLVDLLRIFSHNNPAKYQLSLAEELAGLATAHALHGDASDGLRAAEEAEEILNRIGIPTSISSPLLLWLKVMDTRSILHWMLDEYEWAIRCNEESIEKYREIIKKGSKDGTMDPKIKERYAIALGRLAEQLRQMLNQAPEILPLYRDALDVWMTLLETSPQTRRYVENLQLAAQGYSATEPDKERTNRVLKAALDAIPDVFQDVRIALLLEMSEISADKPGAGEPEARRALHTLDEWKGAANSLPLRLRLAAATALSNSLRRLDRDEEAVKALKYTEERIIAGIMVNPTLSDKPLLQDLLDFMASSSR